MTITKSQPIRVLQIASGRGLNGAFTYCHFLSNELGKRGHSVSALCHPESWLRNQFADDFEVFESSFRRTPAELLRLVRWVRSSKFNLLHTHNTRAHNIGVLLSRITRVPVVATAHSQSIQLHWRFNDFVIANSEATRKYHRRFNRVSDHRMETVFCFSDIDRFREIPDERVQELRTELEIGEQDFVVGVVGSLEPRKNASDVVLAMPEMMHRLPNLKLMLVGPSDEASQFVSNLRELVKRKQLEDRVQFLGPRNDIPALMRMFDVLAVPSLAEPLGLVAMESLAAGTPVVAAEVGGLPEIVQPNVNGLLVPRQDPSALAEAVVCLGLDRDRRRSYGEAGRQMVFEKFTPEKLTKRIEEIYQRLL